MRAESLELWQQVDQIIRAAPAGEWRQRVTARLVKHPAFAEFLAPYRAKAPIPRLLSPFRALGKKLVAAQECTLVNQPGSQYRVDSAPDLSVEDLMRRATLTCLMSKTFLWSRRVSEALQASSPFPRMKISVKDIGLPYPCMFHVHESVGFPDNLEVMADWSLTVLRETSLDLFGMHVDRAGAREYVGMQVCIDGQTYPDDFAESLRPLVGLFLKYGAFLNSTFATIETQMPRSQRKVVGLGTPESEEQVSVIVLRAGAVSRETDEASNPVHWKHRWWVRGHWRVMTDPKTGKQRPIWIAPFIKGPEDRPFLDPVYTVTR